MAKTKLTEEMVEQAIRLKADGPAVYDSFVRDGVA